MGQTGVGQVKRGVNLCFGHGREGRIDDNLLLANPLPDAGCLLFVGFLFDVAKVLGLFQLVFQALFVGEKHHVVGLWSRMGSQISCLTNIQQGLKRFALLQPVDNLPNRLFTHPINQKVGSTAHQNAGQEFVLPIVVVRHPTERSLNASENDRSVRVELFQAFRIDNAGIVGTHVRSSVWGVSIVTSQPFVGCVVVDHRIHRSGRNAEKEPGSP